MTGGHVLLDVVAQGHLDTRIGHVPAAEATRLHLRESVTPGLQLIVKGLSRALQWTADQAAGVHQRIAVASLPAGRGPFLLASEAASV